MVTLGRVADLEPRQVPRLPSALVIVMLALVPTQLLALIGVEMLPKSIQGNGTKYTLGNGRKPKSNRGEEKFLRHRGKRFSFLKEMVLMSNVEASMGRLIFGLLLPSLSTRARLRQTS